MCGRRRAASDRRHDRDRRAALGRATSSTWSPRHLSLVLTAYFLAYGVMLFPGGTLVDRLGSRRVALYRPRDVRRRRAARRARGELRRSWSLSRVVQGIGAGLVSPASLAGAVSGYPPERRGAALGLWGASSGIANLIGPLVGGLLTVAIDWRACWWFLVPVAGAGRLGGDPLRPARDPCRRAARGRLGFGSASSAPRRWWSALTFAVMIGAFFLAQQYLQEAGRLLGARRRRRADGDRPAGRASAPRSRARSPTGTASAPPRWRDSRRPRVGPAAARHSGRAASWPRPRCRC